MSEPLVERLSRFTPDGSALNRDTLLFAAGRASARPIRRWQALAGLLAACQLLTLICFWPRTSAPEPVETPTKMTESALGVDPLDLPFPAPEDPGTTQARLLSGEIEKVEPPSDKPMVPPDPPLHVFGILPDKILN